MIFSRMDCLTLLTESIEKIVVRQLTTRSVTPETQ